MIKYLLLTVVTVAVSSATLHAGEGKDCSGCKGKDKEKTEQSS